MKNLMFIGLFLLTACSPYKKIVIPMSKIQTDNWVDKPEAMVISKLGPYKTKALNETGYILIFDYSSYNHTPQKKPAPKNYQHNVNASVGNNRQIIQPTTYVTTSAKPGLDVNQFEIIKEKAMKFYFDKNKNVIYVDAIGYPDSVRYELRKK
jgi:outer membrane protein assembly factor BamE (lipoprotein component of BamABCDE complex)